MDAVAKNALASLSSLMVVHGSTANDLALTTAATAFSGVGGALRRAAGSADGSGAGFACCHQKNPAATSSALPATHTATGPRRPAFGCRPGRWPGARSATGPTSDTAPPNTLRTRAPNAPVTSPPPRPQRHHDPPRRRRILRRIAHPHDPARENRRRTRPGARPATAPRGGHPTARRAEIPRALSAACRPVGRPLVGRLSRFSTPPRRDPAGHSPLPSGLRSAGPSRPRVGDQPPLIPEISPGGEIR